MKRLIAAWLLVMPAATALAEVEEPTGFWTGAVDAPVPAAIRGGTVIHAAALAALLKNGAVSVDVSDAPTRPAQLAPGAPWLPVPHQALPGAVWIPGVGDGELPPTLDVFFRSQLAAATQGDMTRPVVIYCHARCWLSWNAAKRAIAYGYQRVFWFSDGIEGWSAAKFSTLPVQPTTPLPRLLVLDLELSGDLGGPEFTAEHTARLLMASARLRADIAQTGLYQLVDAAPEQADIDRLRTQQLYLHDCNGCDLDVGRNLGSDLVLVPWVDRVSGLILSLTYEIHDVASGQIKTRKSFDFRGDNDVAWTHAVDYMVRHLKDDTTAVAP